MKLLRSPQVRILPVIAFILLSSVTLLGQTAAIPARVTQPIDAEHVVTLQGNTHPLARPEFDQGAAPDSLPMQRILLVLQRSAEQERTLRELLEEQQIESSPNYHMWLIPEQFGEQFGPVDADIQAVTDWLTSQGFEVNRVAAGRTVIEFSGTAGAVRQALHTEIHKYVVNGEEHWANASDPQIPAALRPVVAGFASLNNFPRHSTMKRLGAFSRSRATGLVKPLFTEPGNNGTNYFLGPTDFATIYNILPLWKASPPIDGTGETIAIVAETNINLQDVADFRNLFGLPANAPQIILNGPDPGITMDETESDLDTQWSSAVAKNATIDLVVSESTETSQGTDLSALYIIDNNLAPVMSESYSCCEAFLGTGGNAFESALYEQGAAQGITIILSTGDTGSAGCDYGEAAAQYGLAVNGLASTPFNVAVGGTDFNDVNTWSTYWSSTNNTTTLASALSYIPEIPWNDSCARNGNASDCASAGSDTPSGIDLTGGSGGASSCITSNYNGESITCTAGYPKPAWQSGPGVPNDGVRDIPDVSLFASNGFDGSSYVVCESDAVEPASLSCNPGEANWVFLGVGGTSASAPAFAGMMALVNQKTGQRQGNANYVLYALAAQSGKSCASSATMAATANSSSCIFYDVTTGNNSVACVGGSPNCSNTTSGGYGMLEVNPSSVPNPAWMATAGYDLATGLGSVNTSNLVNNWASVSFQPTTTTLTSLIPTTSTHGQPVSFSVSVAAGSGSGTPTGNVSLIAESGSSPSGVTAIGSFPLSGGSVTSSTNLLPGGTYNLAAHYAGDGTYGASESAPVQVSITPESSQTHIALLTFDPVSGNETSSNANSVVYGASLNILRADVTNNSGQDCTSSVPYGCPTGQVTLTDNGQPLDLGSYKLNNLGYAEDQTPQFTFGVNKLAASYSGDSSYNTSSSATDTITYSLAPTTVTLSGLPSTATLSAPISFTATVNTQSYLLAPTGMVQVLDGGTPVQATVGSITSTNGSTSGTASLQIPLSIKVSAGVNSITVQYPGDTNYLSSTSAASTVAVGDYSLLANPSTLNISTPGQSGSTVISITPQNGFIGTVSLSCANTSPGMACTISPASVNITGTSPVTAALTVTTTAAVNSSVLPAPRSGADASPLAPKWVAHALTPTDVPPPLTASWGEGITSYLWATGEVIRRQAGRLPHIFLAMLLPVMLLMGVAKKRRPACLLLATALLVVGIWAACSGPSGEFTPSVSLSSASVVFGQQNVGSTSAPQAVIVSNTGSGSLSVSGVAVSGTNASDFAQTNNCGGSVAAGTNCTISVTFAPSGGGPRSASLTVSDNASGSPQTISLSGTGLQPVVSLSPSSLTFAQQSTGSTSTAQSVTLSDTGNTSLNISSFGLSGTDAADFAQTNDCGSGVGVGGSCTIMVTFSPSAAGSRSASLLVSDNASGSPQTVSLNGTGETPATTISLSASSLAFGQENMAATTAPQTITLSNTGKVTLSISSISVAGANPSDFAQTNTCGASVAAGAKCSLSVTFSPTATGSRTASISLADNASGSPQTISLSGTGLAMATPPGNYQVQVNGSSNGDLHSLSVNVTVQ